MSMPRCPYRPSERMPSAVIAEAARHAEPRRPAHGDGEVPGERGQRFAGTDSAFPVAHEVGWGAM